VPSSSRCRVQFSGGCQWRRTVTTPLQLQVSSKLPDTTDNIKCSGGLNPARVSSTRCMGHVTLSKNGFFAFNSLRAAGGSFPISNDSVPVYHTLKEVKLQCSAHEPPGYCLLSTPPNGFRNPVPKAKDFPCLTRTPLDIPVLLRDLWPCLLELGIPRLQGLILAVFQVFSRLPKSAISPAEPSSPAALRRVYLFPRSLADSFFLSILITLLTAFYALARPISCFFRLRMGLYFALDRRSRVPLLVSYSAVVVGGIFGTIGKAGANKQDML
jgi:hypothetical protein